MKRLFDIVMSAIALIIFLPVLLVVATGVRVSLGAPVLFRQIRPGLNGQPFELVKFRTMRTAKAGEGDAMRLTGFGRFLRSTSLDELPELWNVLKGDMSLVGPRPLLMEYLERYSPEQARRHEVRPGLTGWAQINGRNALTWPEKFRLDLWYVDNRSFWLDIRIVAATVGQVLFRRGISAEGEATMPVFMGNEANDKPTETGPPETRAAR